MASLILQRHLDCGSIDNSVACGLLTGLTCSSTECLGQHIGGAQTANLGDGNGDVAQTTELREERFSILGTCVESLVGGNHLRMYRQNGINHPTGALFLACVTCLPPPLLCSVSYRISRRVSVEEVVPIFLRSIHITYL